MALGLVFVFGVAACGSAPLFPSLADPAPSNHEPENSIQEVPAFQEEAETPLVSDSFPTDKPAAATPPEVPMKEKASVRPLIMPGLRAALGELTSSLIRHRISRILPWLGSSPEIISPSLPSGIQIWVESATVKIRPSAQPNSAREAHLSAAKNEFEAFQIALRSDSGIHGIHAEASPLRGPAGSIIPGNAIRIYQVGLIDIQTPSDAQGASGPWPDPLIPALDDLDGSTRNGFPFDAMAGDARAIWVEVLVPANATAGVYDGQLRLHGSEIEGHQVPLRLVVYDFTLPSTPALQTYYQLNDMSVCRGHYEGDPSCGDWGDQKMDLIDKYARFALDHRISLGNIYYQRPIGNDWSEFDRRYGPLLDGTAETRLADAKLTSANYMLPLTAESLASFHEHFVAKGWMERAFDYTADEPGYGSSWDSILGRAELVHAYAPSLRTLVTTTIGEARAHGLDDDIDILVPVVNFTDEPAGGKYAGNQNSTYDSHRGANGDVWIYQSCMSHGCGDDGGVGDGTLHAGYPSLMIDHSALRNRAMEWVAFNFGATGDLYWETSYAYSEDPWRSQYFFTGNGDGTLFYPGTPARVGGSGQIPVASQRLKMLRDSIEDYEYLTMVSRLGDPEFARTQARKVAPTAYGIGVDPAQLEASREALARRIEELLR